VIATIFCTHVEADSVMICALFGTGISRDMGSGGSTKGLPLLRGWALQLQH
jgi:hypothetical protein